MRNILLFLVRSGRGKQQDHIARFLWNSTPEILKRHFRSTQRLQKDFFSFVSLTARHTCNCRPYGFHTWGLLESSFFYLRSLFFLKGQTKVNLDVSKFLPTHMNLHCWCVTEHFSPAEYTQCLSLSLDLTKLDCFFTLSGGLSEVRYSEGKSERKRWRCRNW